MKLVEKLNKKLDLMERAQLKLYSKAPAKLKNDYDLLDTDYIASISNVESNDGAQDGVITVSDDGTNIFAIIYLDNYDSLIHEFDSVEAATKHVNRLLAKKKITKKDLAGFEIQ